MSALALPALYCLFVWWFSTGAILFLDRRARRSFLWSMGGATVLAAASVAGLAASRDDASVGGAYLAFTCGLGVWAWLEMTFYMGFVTGPRREACAPGCHGAAHFGHAVMSCLYHEAATLVVAVVMAVTLSGGANPLGLWTFLLLWVMQVSAKLNVFLGVPNVSEEFLPEHLAFLKSFLNRKPMNGLFPISVTASVALTTLLGQRALGAPVGGYDAAAFSILATLCGLAALEHWFLVLPIQAAALWTWSLVSSAGAALPASPPRGSETPHDAASCSPHHATDQERLKSGFARRDAVPTRLVASPVPQAVQPSLIRRPR